MQISYFSYEIQTPDEQVSNVINVLLISHSIELICEYVDVLGLDSIAWGRLFNDIHSLNGIVRIINKFIKTIARSRSDRHHY